MSREAAASHSQAPTVDVQHGNEAAVTVVEDSNNNTSLIDREQSSAEGTVADGNNSPSIREIHKNSWLKKMPFMDRWSGKFNKAHKPEKFWVVFCVHDDKEAYLEFYENRRSAYSHMPLSNIALSKCLHISPTIVAQENDHDKEPITSSFRPASASGLESSAEHLAREEFTRLSMRDPNSPLPPVPGGSQPDAATPSSTAVVYTRNPPILRASNPGPSSSATSSPTATASFETSIDVSPYSVQGGVFNFDSVYVDSEARERVSRSNSLASQDGVSPVSSPTTASEHIPSSAPNTPQTEQTIYEPLFCPGPSISMGIRNPNYENPPNPQLRAASNPTPALPPRPGSDQRRMSSSVASDIQFAHSVVRTSSLSNMAATSDPSLNASSQNGVVANEPAANAAVSFSPVALLRSQSQQDSSHSVVDRNNVLPLDEGPPPYSNSGFPVRYIQTNSSSSNGAIPVDENGKPLSLREVQVQKLQSEILHKSGVRLVLRKKDCINAIALVECFNYVWVAGWKQKEHPLLHNTFHVGDRIISIAGHRINSVQDAHKAIKHQSSIVEFIVRRVPCGRVLAIKREYEGQDLGIIREGGTAEIKEVKPNGLAARHGLTAKAPNLEGTNLCNWFLTEINHRPLNLFFKDNEVHDRLNAVGLDISILVQPLDLVKAMKKQLKALRSYKDYIVQ